MSQTASKPNQQIRIRPTLILGLGGFGGEVLLKIRRRFYEQHGSLDEFPIVAYRWLDTDGKRPESLGQIPDAIKLSDTERINLSISDPSSITANLKEPSHDHISPWWYPGLNSLSAMSDGVSHIRAYGRLAFFHHYSLIRAAIVDAQTKVRDPLTQEAMMKSAVLRELGLSAQVDFNSPTNVIIVSTISGGTGSGMLLDLTFMVKELLGEGNISSCAYLVFPEVGEEDDHQGRANGYAFLKELNHYQYGVTHYQAEWSRGQRVKVPTPPLDHCYLFDQVCPALFEGSMTEATQELLAEAIFLDFRQGEFSDHKRSVRVNLKQYMSKTFDYEHPRFKQKFIQRYGSLGLSSLQLPHSRIINACSAKLAAAVVQSWLEPSGANETALLARDALLKSLGLFESEQNHDILFALLDPTGKADLDTGRTRGLMHQLEQWGHHLLSEVEQENYRRQRLPLRDWLYLAFQEKERELRHSSSLPVTIQANLDALTSAVEARVQQLINKTLEQGGLKAAQSQLESLSYAMQQQIGRFESHSNELQEHTRQRQNDFHKRLTELSRQQNRRNWDGRTKIVLRYLTERFLQAVIGDSVYPGLLRCQLQLTLLRAGTEVSKNVLNLLQGQARADGQRSGGLQAQLQELDRELRLLQDELVSDSLELERPDKDPHSTSLYRKGEVESKYFLAFVNPSVIQATSKQALISLERSLLSLSTDLSAGGRGLCKKALLSASRPAFRGVKTDFHLLKTLFQSFDAPTRLDYLKSAFQASQFWATASQEHGTFRLAAEQVQLLIGLPGVSAEMDPIQRSEIESYATQLKQLMLRELKSDLNFFEIPDGSQLIIYREVAGFPLNYLERLSGLRDSYLQMYTSGEPLHTTCHDKQFADLMILAPEERESLEEAHECLVLGCIFDLLEYRSGDYLWIEKDVFQMRPHPLGDSSMLLLKLANQPQTRQRLMSLIREKRGHIVNSPLTENLARYAAVLEWHKQTTWGASWGKTSDDSELDLEQLMTLRILKSELDALEEMVAIRGVGLAPFSDMVQHFFEGRELYFRARDDQKLAFIPQPDTELTTLNAQ